MLKLIRKRGGRSYTYNEGASVTPGWAILDEDGNTFESWEELQATKKPKKKAVKKTTDKE